MTYEKIHATELALQAIFSNSLLAMDKSTAAMLKAGAADILLADHGIDSLGKLEMSIFLSEALKVEIGEGDLQEVTTYSELLAFLDKRFGI